MLSQVPAGVATMGALPFGVKRAANIGDEVSKALTYLPRSKAGADVLEALEKPMAAMSLLAPIVCSESRPGQGEAGHSGKRRRTHRFRPAC